MLLVDHGEYKRFKGAPPKFQRKILLRILSQELGTEILRSRRTVIMALVIKLLFLPVSPVRHSPAGPGKVTKAKQTNKHKNTH